MNKVNITDSALWIQEHALKSSERKVYSDGDYTHWLIDQAEVVKGSDIEDSNLCPDELISLLQENYTQSLSLLQQNSTQSVSIVQENSTKSTSVLQGNGTYSVSPFPQNNTNPDLETVSIQKALWGLGSVLFIVFSIIICVAVTRPKKHDRYRVRFSKMDVSDASYRVLSGPKAVTSQERAELLNADQSDDPGDDG
jgi:hypothetical protein